ncbi:MAG TPA: hypothetical protein ENN49_04360 [Bacteroidales bacterium]|nr:hypothetical protein [Bacteroidales bacterium]
MKRIVATIVFLTLAIAGLVFLFYHWVNKHEYRQFNPIDAIPLNASLILNIDDFELFTSSVKSNSWWETLEQGDVVKSFAGMLNYLDSTAKSDNTVRTAIKGTNTAVAFYNHHPLSSEFLLAHKVPKEFNQRDILELIKLQSLGFAKAEEIQIAGYTAIYVEVPEENYFSLTFTVFNNLLLVSNSQELLIESVKKMKEDAAVESDEQFQLIYQTAAAGVAANVFVNINEVSKTLSLENNSLALKGVASWVGLDVQVSPTIVIANGLIVSSTNNGDYYKIFTRQNPVPFSLHSYMPASTSFFTWYGLPGISNFMADYSDYIDNLGLTEPYNRNLSGFLANTGVSINEFLEKNLDNEVAVLSAKLQNDSTEWFILANTKSGSATLQQLESFAGTKSIVKHEFEPDKHKSFLIIENPIKWLIPTLLGNSFLKVSDEFVTVIDNVLVFGSSISSLEFIINEYLRNNTLTRTESYRSVQQRISTSSNLILYSKRMDSYPLSELHLHGKPTQLYKGETLSSHSFIWQIVGGSQKLFAMLVVKSTQANSTETTSSLKNVKWVCKLSSEPVGKPHLLVNHLNGQTEILVQDSENSIYLISNDGHILWERKIDAPILGSVSQVDVYRNKKLQMVFASGNRLYLIDRNGNDVKGFPVTLPAKATSPLSAFDYDNNRNYRFFVACADKRIYCYDVNGKPVSGWLKFKTETVVSNRIGYVRYQGKDFIVIFDQNRPYLLNRRGEERLKPQSLFAKAKNSEFYLAGSSGKGSYLLTTDTLGIIKKLFFDGRVKSQVLEPFSPSHAFCMAGGKYFILDRNRISIYSREGKFLNVILSSIGDFDSGSLQVIPSKNLVLVSRDESVLGYDFGGKSFSGFPISGNIPIVEINSRSKQFVTLSKQNGVICFVIK